MMNKYDDIINFSHYEPKNHPRMSIRQRAAQFAPFAALTGYENKVEEMGRITYEKKEMLEDKVSEIDLKLLMLNGHIKERPRVSVTYFVKDDKKSGGLYKNYIGNLKCIDNINGVLLFADRSKIDLSNIIDINLVR